MKSFVSALMVSASMLAFSPAFAAPTALPDVPTSEVWQAPVSEVQLSDSFTDQIKQLERDSGLQIRVIVTNGGDDLGGDVRGWSVAILRSSMGEQWMRQASNDPRHTVVVIYTAEAGTSHGSTGVRVGRALNDIGILPPHLSAVDGPILPVVRAAQFPTDGEAALLQVVNNLVAEWKAGHTLRFDANGVIAQAAAPSFAPPAPAVASPAATASAPSTVATSVNDVQPAQTDDNSSGFAWFWWLIGIGTIVVVMLLGTRGRNSRSGKPTVASSGGSSTNDAPARDLGDVAQEKDEAARREAPKPANQGTTASDSEAEIRRALAAAEAAQAHRTTTRPVDTAPAPQPVRRPTPPAAPRRVEPVRTPTPVRSAPARTPPRPSSRVSTPAFRHSSGGSTVIVNSGCTTVVSAPNCASAPSAPSTPSCGTSTPSASSCGGGTGSSASSCGSSGGSSCGSSS